MMKTRLRIALYHNLPSGGAKRTVAETVRRLAQRHDVDLFCPSTADSAFSDVRPFVRQTVVFPYQTGQLFSSPFGRLNAGVRLLDLRRMEALTRRVAGEIDARGYDVVLVHPCTIVQAPSVLTHLHTPSVYFCHEPPRSLYEPTIDRPYETKTRFRRSLDRLDLPNMLQRLVVRHLDARNVRAARRVLTNSQYTREAIRQIYRVDAQVNRLGVDSERFQSLGLERAPSVVSVGALKPEKGFDFVIESLGTIPESERPSLTVISNFEVPGEQAYLRHLARRREVSATFRVGVPDDELVMAYNQAALMAYAPIREPLGLAALEAQACQTPVIGIDEAGVRETVIHGTTGLRAPRDPARFGDALRGLLGDAARRERYGRQAREHVTGKWTWDISVAELESALVTAASCSSERQGLSDPEFAAGA